MYMEILVHSFKKKIKNYYMFFPKQVINKKKKKTKKLKKKEIHVKKQFHSESQLRKKTEIKYIPACNFYRMHK